MSRSQFSLSAALLFLLPGFLLDMTPCAHSTSCRKVASCVRAFAQAEAATSPKQRLAAIVALKEAYGKVADPRLLVSMGNLLSAVGNNEEATAACLQAQSLAPADMELQAQVKECLAKASTSLLPSEQSKPPTVNTSRAQAKGGRARATVNNNINVNPQINVSPQVQVAPQLHLIQGPTATVDRVPVYRKWWFWTGLGVVTAAAAVSLGLGLAAREPDTTGYPTFHVTSALVF